MTWLLCSICLAIGILIGRRWPAHRVQVGHGEADMSWPGRGIRVINHDPFEVPHGWESEP